MVDRGALRCQWSTGLSRSLNPRNASDFRSGDSVAGDVHVRIEMATAQADPGLGSAAGTPGHAEPPADAARYWTPARMRQTIPAGPTASAGRAGAAIPVSGQGGTGSSWPDGGPVARATGKVFFTLAGADYVCSAAAVTSPRADVVVTAGHCVSDGAGHWATNGSCTSTRSTPKPRIFRSMARAIRP